jgi:hypothetical protein
MSCALQTAAAEWAEWTERTARPFADARHANDRVHWVLAELPIESGAMPHVNCCDSASRWMRWHPRLYARRLPERLPQWRIAPAAEMRIEQGARRRASDRCPDDRQLMTSIEGAARRRLVAPGRRVQDRVCRTGVGSDSSQLTDAVFGPLAFDDPDDVDWQPGGRSRGTAVARTHRRRTSGSDRCSHSASRPDWPQPGPDQRWPCDKRTLDSGPAALEVGFAFVGQGPHRPRHDFGVRPMYLRRRLRYTQPD